MRESSTNAGGSMSKAEVAVAEHLVRVAAHMAHCKPHMAVAQPWMWTARPTREEARELRPTPLGRAVQRAREGWAQSQAWGRTHRLACHKTNTRTPYTSLAVSVDKVRRKMWDLLQARGSEGAAVNLDVTCWDVGEAETAC